MDNQQKGSAKPSFFDDSAPDQYVFWKQQPAKNPSQIKTIGSILFQRCSDTWKSQYYILFEDRLGYFKEEDTEGQEELGYCNVQNMRLEPVVKGAEKEREEKYGFRLTHNGQSQELFAETKADQERWMEILTRSCVLTQYSAYYSNIKVIGQGRFAWVNLAKRKSDGVEFAVKTFSKDKLLNEDKAQASLINEINIMRQLDQESIIKFYKIYESDHNIYLILELLNGGELFERIVQKGQYNEHDASILMKKLLGALAHMHSKGIMHRDIKPENLILKDADNDWNVKIADFGLAQAIDAENYLFKRCGTPGYVAPELLADQKYAEKVDIFSAGLILYILLTGGSPFYSECYEEILWKNQNCDISFDFPGHRISSLAVDLMMKMLAKDPMQRISANEALQHEWIVTGGTFLSPKSNTPIFLQLAQENMKRFQEAHGLNHKPHHEDADFLERSVHAPSPLITGRVDQIAENRHQFVMNSPEMSIGAALANRQMMMAGLKSPNMSGGNANRNMFPPRNGNMNQDKYQNAQMMNSMQNRNNNSNKNPRDTKHYTMYPQPRPSDMSADMAMMHNTPKTAPIHPQHPQSMTSQKAKNVHQNFMKYLHANSPQPQPSKARFSANLGPQEQQNILQMKQMPNQQYQQQTQPQYQPFKHPQSLQQYLQNPQNQQQQQQKQSQPKSQGQSQPQPQSQSQQQVEVHNGETSTKKAKNITQNLLQFQ